MTTGSIRYENPLEPEGLRLYAARSAPFEAAVEELFSPDDRVVVAPILPYSVLIHNTTGRYLAAVSIAFSHESPIEPGVMLHNRVSPAAQVPDRGFMLAPDASIFIPMDGGLCGTLDAAGHRHRAPAVLGGTSSQMAALLALVRQRDVIVSADCFVTEDGALHGPDLAGFERCVHKRRQAEAALYRAVEVLRGAELRRHLRALAEKDRAMDDPDGFYLAMRAGSLLDEFEEAGEPALKTEAAQRHAQLAGLPALHRKRPAAGAR